MDLLLHCLKAFFVGGGICLIGQILIDYTKLTPARILVGYVVSGVILTAIGLYDPLVAFAGAGAAAFVLGAPLRAAGGVLQRRVLRPAERRRARRRKARKLRRSAKRTAKKRKKNLPNQRALLYNSNVSK